MKFNKCDICGRIDMRRVGVALTAMALAATFIGCTSGRSSRDIPVVKGFDAGRYMGVWYEIARLPKWFERDLNKVTATYAMVDGELRITNRGFRNGEEQVSTAVGHFAGSADEGAFRISFFRPFYGDYRIIWLSQDYDLALVTGDDRSSLWILARDKDLPSVRSEALVEMAVRWGFDVSALEYPKNH